MPKIVTYEQQVGMPENRVISSGASPEIAGAEGSAIAGMGQQIGNFGEALQRHDENQDINDTHMALSKLRNDYTTRIQAETQTGNIDTEKLHQDYEDDVNKITGNMQTRKGQEFLSVHSAQLGSDLIHAASVSQAQVAGKLAVEQWNNSLNLNGNTLQSSPSSFDGTLRDSISAIEAQVQNGSLSRVMAEELKRKTGEQLSEAAVHGWANINADQAKKVLDSGTFDKYMDNTKKESLYGTIRAYKNAEITEQERVLKLQKEAKEKTSEKWQNDALTKMNDNSLSPKQILESPMTASQKHQWLGWQKQHINEQFSTDKQVVNNLQQRILLPDTDTSGQRIVNQQQLMQYLGKGATIEDVKKLTKFIDETPQGKELASQRKIFFDAAKKQIIKTDMFSHTSAGHENLAKLTDAALKAEEQAVKDGKNPGSVYDSGSKDSMWNQMDRFKMTADDFRNQAMGQFTKDTPGKVQVPGGPQNLKRLPGEKPADYLKRTGK